MGRKQRSRYPARRVPEACRQATWHERDVRNRALEAGLTLRVSSVTSGRTELLHWMFDDAQGGRVLNYWPSNGKVWSPVTSYKGTVPDVWAALELAKQSFSPGRENRQTVPSRPRASYVGWVQDEPDGEWREVCDGATEADCLRQMAKFYRGGKRCFVTRGDDPDTFFSGR